MKKIISLSIVLMMAIAMQAAIILGSARTSAYLPLIEGQRVALMSNHTGIVPLAQLTKKEQKDIARQIKKGTLDLGGQTENIHLLDLLIHKGIHVTAVFSPEHGFRGTAREGEIVQSSVDEKTGVPILSLYDGKGGRPSDEAMNSFDVLIVDIQDVGLRFYTYYITMVKLMDVCADWNKKVIVLDRPNPNGHYVDGPILDMKHKSGVGYLPIPVVHGMTLGELARMVNGEGWLTDGKKVDLTVIPCSGYTHATAYRIPVAPSPNLRTMKAVYLYPSLCLFEGTPFSVGRGTDHPFTCYGHPLYACGHEEGTSPAITGAPISFTPSASTQKGRYCHGMDLSVLSDEEAKEVGFTLDYVIDAYKALKTDNFFFSAFFEKLVGVDYIRKMIIAGNTNEEIRARWADDVAKFKEQRKPYLLYE